jgi:uncharacterized protein (DUF2147 family)
VSRHGRVRVRAVRPGRAGPAAPALLLALLLPAAAPAALAGRDDAFGRWWLPDGNGQLHVEPAGDGLIGRVACLARVPAAGEPGPVDANNPDPAQRERPVLGLALLEGFRWNERAGRWEDGTIYDPDTGSTYASRVWLDGGGDLRARGYLGAPMFGRTVVFRHVPAGDVVRDGPCGTPRAD